MFPDYGIQRMRNAMKLAGLPKPEFDMDGFFIVTLMRESFIKQIGDSVGDSVGDKKLDLSEIQIEILRLLRENPKLSAGKLKTLIGISNRSIERNIVSLKELGMLKRIGPDFGGHWEVTYNRAPFNLMNEE